jgi:hypothetical protein
MASGRQEGAGLPDRVPVFCQLAVGHYFLHSGLDPFDIWYRSAAYAEALLRLAKRYGFDGILVNLPGRDPGVERHIQAIETQGGSRVVRWRDGSHSILPADDNPHHFPAPGGRNVPSFEEIDPEELYYVEPWDLKAVSYPWTWGFEEEPRPFQDYFPEHHLDTLKIAVESAGGELSVHSEVFSPFSQLLEFLGYERALLAIVDAPGKIQACLERLTAGAADLARRQAACGADAILISSAFAGAGFISREHYRLFVLPHERRLVDEIRKGFPEVPIYTHTCGKIGDRLDLMLQTGTMGIDTLDPPPLGTVDLADAKRELSGKAFIKGNIDPVNTLLEGSPAKVRQEASARLRVGKPGGGYILSSACSVPPRAPPGNLQLLSEVAELEGRY